MVTSIYITSNGFFRGNGLIHYLTRDLIEEDIQYESVLNEVIRDIKRLHDIYILSIIDDGKITGRERLLVCKELDILIGDLILLRLILQENHKEFDLINRNKGTYLKFKVIKARWEGFGEIGENFNLEWKKIKEWVQNSYSIKLKALINYSKLALEDGKLEPHEKHILSVYIEKLLLAVILARDGIYTTKIS